MGSRADVAVKAIENGRSLTVATELTDGEVRELRARMRAVERAQLNLDACVMQQRGFLSDLTDRYELVNGDNIHPRTGVITRVS